MQTSMMKLEGPLAIKGIHAFRGDTPKGPYGLPRTWFMVADRKQAYIYHRHDHDLECIAHATPDTPAASYEDEDFGRTKQGRISHRQTFGPTDEALRSGDMMFMRGLCEFLENALQQDGYEALVIAAAPKTLGDLRQMLPDRVRSCVTAELDKDLVNLPEKDVQKALASVVKI